MLSLVRTEAATVAIDHLSRPPPPRPHRPPGPGQRPGPRPRSWSLALPGIDREPAADPLRAGAHAGEAEMAGRDGPRRRSRAPSSMTARRMPSATRPTSQPDRVGGRVLDDVVERLLARSGRGSSSTSFGSRSVELAASTTTGRPIRPWTRRGLAAQRGDEPVVLEAAGPELEDQRPHLGQGVALEVAQRVEPLPWRGDGSWSSSSSMLRVMRVIVNSAWVTESWSSRARWARSWPGGELPGLAPEVGLEALAFAQVADGRPGRPRTGRRVDGDARATSTGIVAVDGGGAEAGRDQVVLAGRDELRPVSVRLAACDGGSHDVREVRSPTTRRPASRTGRSRARSRT